MSHGHNGHKGFSQSSKRFDGGLKEQIQKNRSTQHSTVTAKESSEEKPSKDSGRSAKK